MTAHTGPRLEDVHPRMLVRQIDRPPYIDLHLFADQREFVGKGNVDVAIGVLDQLDEFRGAAIGHEGVAGDEGFIQRQGAGRALIGHAADDAVVGHEFAHHLARQDPLRAMGDEDIRAANLLIAGKRQIRPRGGQTLREPLRGADRRGGFQDHGIAALQQRRDRVCRGVHIGQIGLFAVTERRRHGQDEVIRLHRGRLRPQTADLDRRGEQHLQVGFLEMGPPVVECRDNARIGVAADHLVPAACQHRRCRQSDIAKTDDANLAHDF